MCSFPVGWVLVACIVVDCRATVDPKGLFRGFMVVNKSAECDVCFLVAFPVPQLLQLWLHRDSVPKINSSPAFAHG